MFDIQLAQACVNAIFHSSGSTLQSVGLMMQPKSQQLHTSMILVCSLHYQVLIFALACRLVMKESKGRVNPGIMNKILMRRLQS